MTLFLLFWFANVASVAVVFELSQRLSVAAGQIPARGIHEWQGKPFLHWDAFVCQSFGDLICLSGLNAAFVVALGRAKLTAFGDIYLCAIAALGVIATIIWVVNVKKQFASGVFGRWDWGFTAPAGKLTIAGWIHLIYFAVEAGVIGSCILCFLWKPIGLWIRVFMAICIVGYAITAIYDAKKIGMSGGPFGATGPKRT